MVSNFVKDRLASEMRSIDKEGLRTPAAAEAALAAAHHRTQEALKASGIDVSLSGACRPVGRAPPPPSPRSAWAAPRGLVRCPQGLPPGATHPPRSVP